MAYSENGVNNISDPIQKFYRIVNQLSFGIPDILRFAVRRFGRVNGAEAAAGMAFFTIFSMFPLLLVLVAIGGFLLESEQVQNQIVNLVEITVPISTDLVISNMEQVLEERGAIGIIGLIGLVWSASGGLTMLIRNINRAWPAARARNFIQSRLIAFIIIAVLVILLALSSIATAVINLLPEFGLEFLTETPAFSLLFNLAPFLVGFFIFTSLYRWVPTVPVSWLAASISGFVASLAWQLSTTGFTWYLRSGLVQYRLVYGSLGTIVALMFWIYINCLIIIFCAHLCSAIMHQTGEEVA